MHITISVVGDGYVVNHVVAVEVQVIDPCVLIVDVSLERFEGLRLLEEIHDCVEVQVITRETQVFLRVILGADCCHCYQNCEDRCAN